MLQYIMLIRKTGIQVVSNFDLCEIRMGLDIRKLLYKSCISYSYDLKEINFIRDSNRLNMKNQCEENLCRLTRKSIYNAK